MSEQRTWVWTDCKLCGYKASARSLGALLDAMNEHDRFCGDPELQMYCYARWVGPEMVRLTPKAAWPVDLHSDPAPVEMNAMK